jgi:hypothetical protein
MLHSKALTAEDMRWRWGLRTVIIKLVGRKQKIALLAFSNVAQQGIGSRVIFDRLAGRAVEEEGLAIPLCDPFS